MAKVKSVLTKDEYEALPEAVRSLGWYEQKGESWVIDNDVQNHPETKNLVKALGEEREGKRTWKDKAAAFEALGLSVEEIADLKKKHDTKPTDGGDDLAAKVEAEVNRRMGPIETAARNEKARADAAEADARNLRIETHHRSLAGRLGVIPERVDRAIALNRSRFGLDKDGNHQLVDAKGNPEAVTPEKFWSEVFKDEMPEWYQGTGSRGGGAGEGGRAGGGKTIAAGDDKAFLANVDKVAKGEVAVR